MALIHSYFVDIFLHGKLLHSSASRTHVTIYDVKKCQKNTRESMPNYFTSILLKGDNAFVINTKTKNMVSLKIQK